MGPGTVFYIRPHPNLADIFGADNRFGLASGPDAKHADNVVVWDPEAQEERVYYFHSTRARWEEKGINADASNAVMRFPYGLYIIRRSLGTLRIALSGEIGADPVLLPVRTGDNIFSLPINLSSSLDNLISSEGVFPVIKGKNANKADHPIATGSRTGGGSTHRRIGIYHTLGRFDIYCHLRGDDRKPSLRTRFFYRSSACMER